MGHTLGSHTHTHYSSANLWEKEMDFELTEPKFVLKKLAGAEIFSFSYPFGEPMDCLPAYQRIKKYKLYRYAFTIEPKVNTASTDHLDLGRYSPNSKETPDDIIRRLKDL